MFAVALLPIFLGLAVATEKVFFPDPIGKYAVGMT
jgi:hypothetical protein